MKNVVCRLLQNTRYLVRHTFSVCRDSSEGFFLLKTFVFFLIRTPHFLGQIHCYFFRHLTTKSGLCVMQNTYGIKNTSHVERDIGWEAMLSL